MSGPLTFSIDDGVATCVLNRPQRMNALNRQLVDALNETLNALGARDDVRVLIVSGAGDRAFCAGADLKERSGMDETQVRETVADLQKLMNAIAGFPRPVIAAINGHALGGGLELALASDIRIASTTAKMGLPETRLAIIPGAGGTQRLPRIVGLARAKEMIFTGRSVDAEEALRIGLITESVQGSRLMARAGEIAGLIAEGGPVAVEQAKLALDRGMDHDLATGLVIERDAYQRTIPTQDRVEALAAFAEKRTPRFTGS